MSTTTRFAGAIPALYDRHLGPVLFDPYARDLCARVPPDARTFLEIAAGTGRVTRQLLAVLPPDAAVVATDLNDDMITQGRQATPDPRASWRQADAQALPVEDGGFDAVLCQFGLMFFPDKPGALGEMRRALRPGGTLLLNTWDALARNPLTELLHARASAASPNDPPMFMLTPFSLPDPIALRELIEAAGFTDVRVDTVAATAEATSAADLAIGLVRGNPLWHELVARGTDADAFERELVASMIESFGDRPCRSPLSAHVVMATA